MKITMKQITIPFGIPILAAVLLAGCGGGSSALSATSTTSPTGNSASGAIGSGGQANGGTQGQSSGGTNAPAGHSGNGTVTGATPGHGSPKAAAAGFLDGMVTDYAGTTNNVECLYVDPGDQNTCQQQPPGRFFGQGNYLSGASLPNQVVQGTEALVSATGSFNSNPNVNMPSDTAAFSTTYTTVAQGLFAGFSGTATAGQNYISPLPCIEVNGSWYINMEPSNSFQAANGGSVPGYSHAGVQEG